jgi:hypothetical protein
VTGAPCGRTPSRSATCGCKTPMPEKCSLHRPLAVRLSEITVICVVPLFPAKKPRSPRPARRLVHKAL